MSDLPLRLDETNETVHTNQAQRVVDLVVKNGGDLPAAAEELGLTAAELRAIHPQIRERVRGIIERFGVPEEVQKLLARARLTEFVMQEEDPGLALNAVKLVAEITGMKQAPTVAVTFTRPPEAERAARTLERETQK